jgi:hypothetical protein
MSRRLHWGGPTASSSVFGEAMRSPYAGVGIAARVIDTWERSDNAVVHQLLHRAAFARVVHSYPFLDTGGNLFHNLTGLSEGMWAIATQLIEGSSDNVRNLLHSASRQIAQGVASHVRLCSNFLQKRLGLSLLTLVRT